MAIMKITDSWIKPGPIKRKCQVLGALRLHKEQGSLIKTLERVAASPVATPCRVSYAQRWLAELRGT